jgi:hypothetical protein
MRYRALGCIVALTASLLAAPLEVDAQPSAKVATMNILIHEGLPLLGVEDHRMDLAAWLQGLGLERYVPAFRDNEIDWAHCFSVSHAFHSRFVAPASLVVADLVRTEPCAALRGTVFSTVTGRAIETRLRSGPIC